MVWRAVFAFQSTRAKTRAHPVAAQQKLPSFCGTFNGCVCIVTHPRQNASTPCGSATKATQLLLGFAGLCVHCNAPAPKRDRSLWQRNISVVCYVALCGAVRAFASKFSKFAANVQKARRCVVLSHVELRSVTSVTHATAAAVGKCCMTAFSKPRHTAASKKRYVDMLSCTCHSAQNRRSASSSAALPVA